MNMLNAALRPPSDVAEYRATLAALRGQLGCHEAQGRSDLIGLDLDGRALLASGVSHELVRSRPSTTTRAPLPRESATFSAKERQAVTRRKLAPLSWNPPWPSSPRGATAKRKLATGTPPCVKRSSGSSVRSPRPAKRRDRYMPERPIHAQRAARPRRPPHRAQAASTQKYVLLRAHGDGAGSTISSSHKTIQGG